MNSRCFYSIFITIMVVCSLVLNIQQVNSAALFGDENGENENDCLQFGMNICGPNQICYNGECLDIIEPLNDDSVEGFNSDYIDVDENIVDDNDLTQNENELLESIERIPRTEYVTDNYINGPIEIHKYEMNDEDLNGDNDIINQSIIDLINEVNNNNIEDENEIEIEIPNDLQQQEQDELIKDIILSELEGDDVEDENTNSFPILQNMMNNDEQLLDEGQETVDADYFDNGNYLIYFQDASNLKRKKLYGEIISNFN
jgi:hypothetical protein